MYISLNWLTDYVDVDLPAEEMGELFTRIGLNCEGIDATGQDVVFDLEVTSNRSDCLGHIGVARELAVATGNELRLPKFTLPAKNTAEGECATQIADCMSVDVLSPELCPRYTARLIRDVTVGPSPQWLIDYLQAIGLRSVNNIVDITNFVLMEYAQPLHSFDYDKLAQGRIVVRRAKGGEKITSIDETDCELTDEMLVIADGSGPVALAGIMGSQATEVTAETTTVLIEAAQFDPLATRRTSRALGIMSESNFRFERGVDPVAIDTASQRACALICELAGGEMVAGLLDVWAQPYQAPTVELRPQRTNKLLGMDIPAARQVEILAGLGLSPELTDDSAEAKIACEIPPFRADLHREVDLIEEVARLVGYDQIPLREKVSHRVTPMGQTERIRREITRSLAATGYSEAITFSFIDAVEAELFGLANPICVDSQVRKTNNALRPTLLPSLLRACKSNFSAGNQAVSLFELAAVFPSLDSEHITLAMVSTTDLRDVRGCLDAVIGRIAPDAAITVQPGDVPGLAGGVSATVLLDGQDAGVIGETSSAVMKHFGLEKPIAVATLRLEALSKLANLTRRAHVLAKFPPICRDLSLILDEQVSWGELIQTLRLVTQPLRVGEKYVTTYRGKPLPPGKKSVTMSLEYRWAEGTLTGEEVDAQIAELLKPLQQKFAADIRTA